MNIRLFNRNISNYPSFKAQVERKLTKEENNQISAMHDLYDSINTEYVGFYGKQRNIFRELFPSMREKSSHKGFYLIDDKQPGEKIHLFRYKKNSPLLIEIIDKDQKVKFSCTTNNGSMKLETSAQFDQENLVKEQNVDSAFHKVLKKTLNELSFLDTYAKYFLKIQSKLTSQSTKQDIVDAIKRIDDAKSTIGVKDLSDKLMSHYSELYPILHQKNGMYSHLFKEAYLQEPRRPIEKGVTFKYICDEKINFSPRQSTTDDRIFRITKEDKDGNLNLAIFGYPDGKLYRIVDLKNIEQATKYNMEMLTDRDIQEMNIQELMEFTINEIDNFKNFIINYTQENKINSLHYISERTAKISNRENKVRLPKAKKSNFEERKQLRQERISKENEARKANKEINQGISLAIKAFKISTKISKKLEEKRIKQLKEFAKKAEKEEKAKQKREADNKSIEKNGKKVTKNLKKTQKDILEKEYQSKKYWERDRIDEAKRKENEEKLLRRKKEKELAEREFNKRYRYTIPSLQDSELFTSNNSTSFQNINIAKLNRIIKIIFETPVELRDPRYSHLVMKNGKVFNGKFIYKALDGTNINVTQVQSTKYGDLKYYSIKVEKDNQAFTLNLHPKNARIILSNKSGIPIISYKKVSFDSKSDFVKKYPLANELGKYLIEMFWGEGNNGKYIQSELTDKKIAKRPRRRLSDDKIDEIVTKELEKLDSLSDDIFAFDI